MKLHSRAIEKYRREGTSGITASLLDIIFDAERLNPLYAAVIKHTGNRTSHHDVTLDLDFACIDDEIRARFVRGSYESIERWFVEHYITGGTDVIDLGGGLGFVACYLDECIDPSDKLVVLEANEALIPVIERTEELNDASFELHHGAYAPESETVSFESGDVATAGSVSKTEVATVKAFDLRRLVSRHELEQFNLVVDIEGSEYEMLTEEADVLSNRCSILIAEVHEVDGRTPTEFQQAVEEMGFSLLDERDNVVVYRNETLQ